MKFKMIALALAMPGLLVGCGGGGSDDEPLQPSNEAPIPEPEPEVPEPRLFSNGDLSVEPSLGTEIPIGIYQYTQTSPSNGSELVGLAIISESGRIALALENSIDFARIELNENDRFSMPVESTETPDDNVSRVLKGGRDTGVGPDALARISGSVINDETQALVHNYRMDKQAPDERTLTLAGIAATYSGIDDTGVGSAISLSSDGTLMGSDTTGCEYVGEVIIPDGGEDVIEMSYTASNCGPTVDIPGDSRDGDWFAVGRIDVATGTLSMFGTNGSIGTRISGTNNDPDEEVVEESATFFTNDFNEEPSIAARLEPGVYDYQDIPLGDGATFIESGLMMISNTGRIVVATDSRLAVTRVTVSDVDTFRGPVVQSETPGTDRPPSNASEIFGTPDNSGGGGSFNLAGSLLGNGGELENRYSATRDTTNDGTFTTTPLTLTQLSGTYSGTRNPGAITATLTIASDGTIAGSDTTGCAYNGIANVPNGESGLIEVQIDAANCSATTAATGAERDGDYNGVGDFLPGSPDRIRVVMGSPINVEFLDLDRQ